MAVNDPFIAWCEEERAVALEGIAILERDIAKLTQQGLKGKEVAAMRQRIERLTRYFDSLGETMDAHRALKGRPSASEPRN